MNYSDIVEQMIRVQSTPDATVGDIKIRCVGAPVTEECMVQNNEYVCTVRQLLYIEFPVKLSVHTDMVPEAIDGKEPGLLPEPPQIPRLKPRTFQAAAPSPAFRIDGGAAESLVPTP